MAFGDAFAKSIVESQMDKIKALPVEQRKPVLVQMILKAKQNPLFNQSGLEVSELTTKNLQDEESDFEKRKEAIRSSSGWTDEQMMERGAIGQHQIDTPTRRNAELESVGVITDRDFDAGDWKLGFGASKVDDIRNVLTQKHGKPVQVIKDGEDIIYLDPNEQKLVKVNLTGAQYAGHAIPMAADVAGTTVVGGTSPAGAVIKTVAKETLGSGVFTALGEGLRLAIGKGLGVHDMASEDIAKKSIKTGAEAAAFTGGIGSLVAGVKGITNFVKGGVFNAKEAEKFGLSADEANQVISEVNDILKRSGKDNKLKATLAQKTDDLELASMEAQARTSAEHGQKFADRTKADQAALGESLESVSAPSTGPDMGIGDVGDIARTRAAKRIETGKQIVAKNTSELNQQMSQIGKTQKETVGEPTLDYLKLKRDTAKQATDQVWENVAKIGGFDDAARKYNIDIPSGELTKKLKGEFKRRTSTAQTKIAAGGTGSIYKDTAGKPQDLFDLNREISDLRREASNIHVGRGRGTTSEKDINEVIGAMVEDRRTALLGAGRKDIMDAIEAAEKQSLDYHEAYTRSAVGDLMEKNANGVPVIKSKEFVDDMLKRDESEVTQFVDVMGDNMELFGKWKEGLADTWKSAAFVNGQYKPEASKKWIRKNSSTLSNFFTPAELKSLEKTGKLSEKVAKQTKQMESFVKKANDKWGMGAISKVDPRGLTKFITGKGGSWATPSGKGVQERVSKIKYVKNMTANNPAAWRRIQNDFKKTVRDDIFDAKTGLIKPTAIAKWVSDSENAKVLKEVLGTSYYKDLGSINDAVKIINKKENRLTDTVSTKAAIQAVRAGFAPPLTQRGRILTAMVTLNNSEAQKRAADALLSEVTMKKTANLLKHSTLNRRILEKAVSLGYMLPDED